MVKSAHRALKILDYLTSVERPVSFAELGTALELPQSSLHGLLGTLVDDGWALHDPVKRSYSLGIRALEAGNTYTRAVTLIERARPLTEALRDEVNETVQMAVLEGRFNVYVAKADGGGPLTLASEVGRRLPAHATGVGKVLLADLSRAELERLMSGTELERFTDSTITDPKVLFRRLEEIRQSGFGTDREELTEGVHCVAVPVRDHTRRVVAALSVSAPAFRFNTAQKKAALGHLVTISGQLSSALGWPGA